MRRVQRLRIRVQEVGAGREGDASGAAGPGAGAGPRSGAPVRRAARAFLAWCPRCKPAPCKICWSCAKRVTRDGVLCVLRRASWVVEPRLGGIGLPGIRAPACVVTMRGYVVGEASHWFMMREGDIGTLMHKCKLLVGVCRRRAAALCDRGGGGAAGGRVHDRRAQLLPGCKATAQGCAGALWRFPKAGCADMCPGCERSKIGHALLLNKP